MPLLSEMVLAGIHYSDNRLDTTVDLLVDSMSIMMALLQLALHCGQTYVKQRLTTALDRCCGHFLQLQP